MRLAHPETGRKGHSKTITAVFLPSASPPGFRESTCIDLYPNHTATVDNSSRSDRDQDCQARPGAGRQGRQHPCG